MYVDGFVVPVKTARKDEFRVIARESAEIFRECGALRVVENWSDDVPGGTNTSFPLAVKLEDDETAVFSWVEWPDKAARDAGNAKIESDPRMAAQMATGILSGKRLIYGGFSNIIDL